MRSSPSGELADTGELHAVVPVAMAHPEDEEAGGRLGQMMVPLPIGAADPWARHTPNGSDAAPPPRTRRAVGINLPRPETTPDH